MNARSDKEFSVKEADALTPQRRALVNNVRTRLNESAQELLAGVEGALPVLAAPVLGYLLKFGAEIWERAGNVNTESRTCIGGY